jgi:hypothetical protein
MSSYDEIKESFKKDCRKHRIKLLDASHLHFECEKCGQIWSPNIQTGGRMPRGWWKCPNGCNVEK